MDVSGDQSPFEGHHRVQGPGDGLGRPLDVVGGQVATAASQP